MSMWWLTLPVFAVAAFFTGYLVLLSTAAVIARLARRPEPPGRSAAPPYRFAVVIPAHNESATLPATLAALAAQDYPRPQYEVVVIADNCDDDTASVARKQGARVLERTDSTRRGKGPALGWAFARLLEEQRHDAFLVLDADTRPAPDVLTRFAAALRRGASVVQGRCAVGNTGESWRTAMMTADMALIYYLRPAGRQALGASVDIQGTAFVLVPAVLRQVPWQATSVVEDREYHLRLLLHGFRSVFVPEAVVYTVMEPTLASARQQELRWEGGRMGLARQHLGALLRAAWRRRARAGWWPYLDTAVDLAIPPFALLAGGTAAMTALHAVAFGLAGGPGGLAALWATLLAAQAFYVFAGCALARVPTRAYAALFVYGPLYAIAKVGCYVALVRRGGHGWIPTTRRPSTERATP
jgi:cellulose synthase/poly-beta-1,6-N-acetylglucosamine synthase-like glycosyltransferase